MERTTMAVLITGILAVAGLFGGMIVGMGVAQTQGTEQLRVCAESGGSYLVVGGDPVCIMPGQDIPEQ